MSNVDKFLRHGEKVLAEAKEDEDFVRESPFGWFMCKVLVAIMLAETFFLCIFIFKESAENAALGHPFNHSLSLMGHYACQVILLLMTGVTATKKLGGFSYDDISKEEGLSKGDNPLMKVEFSSVSYSSYYVHWLILSFAYTAFTFFCWIVVSNMANFHFSFREWAAYSFESTPSIFVAFFLYGAFCLGYLFYILITPLLRRRRKVVYYATTQRLMRIDYNTEIVKYLELSDLIDLHVRDERKYLLVNYRYSKTHYSPGEVYEFAIRGVTFPGKLLQEAADQNYRLRNPETLEVEE